MNRIFGEMLRCAEAFKRDLREVKTEGTSLALFTIKDNRTALGDDNLLGHKEAEAGAVRASALGITGAVELRKQMVLLGLRHANTVINDFEFD